MTMVERVALAIAQEEGGGPSTAHLRLDKARAAIEAMREPSEAMTGAVTNVLSHFEGEFGDYNVYFEERQGEEVWRAMIDAALAEAPDANHS